MDRIERSGFTLIELLVALVLSGVIVGSIFQLLVGQSLFVERQSAREEVQQNSRAALELIGSELRTLPGGDALVRAESELLTIRAVRSWGVICAVGGSSSIDVVFPVLSGVGYGTNLGTGAVVNLGTPAAPIWSGSTKVNSVGGSSSSCNGVALATGAERRTLSLNTTPTNGSLTPQPGNLVYLFDQVTYRPGTSNSVPGTWIQRRIGEGIGSANQPMAGPIRDSGGLRFEYYASGSSTPIPTPINDAATRATVSRVVVIVESISRNFTEDMKESKADTIAVPLRNRAT